MPNLFKELFTASKDMASEAAVRAVKKPWTDTVGSGSKSYQDSIKSNYNTVRKEFNRNADKQSMFTADGFPKNMNPVGDKGWYFSDDKFFDPRDCSNPRNATSPWCGYNPISTSIFDPGLSFKLNQCGGYFTLAPTIGFIEFPPAYGGYIKPECREDYNNERKLSTPQKNESANQPTPFQLNAPPTPDQENLKLQDECWYIIALGYAKTYAEGNVYARQEVNKGSGFGRASSAGLYSRCPGSDIWGYTWRNLNEGSSVFGNTSTSTSGSLTTDPSLKDNIWDWGDGTNTICGDSKDYRVISAPEDYYYSTGLGDGPIIPICTRYTGWRKGDWTEIIDGRLASDRYPTAFGNAFGITRHNWFEAWWMAKKYYLVPAIIYRRYDLNTGKVGGACDGMVFAGYGSNIKKYIEESVWAGENISPRASYKISYFVVDIYEFPCPQSSRWHNPPWEEDCVKCCCDGNSYQEREKQKEQDRKDDELLKLLKEINKKLGEFPEKIDVYDDDPDAAERQKRTFTVPSVAISVIHFQEQINNILQILGIEEFPVTYPDSLVEPIAQNGVEKLWNWIKPKKTRKIKSLAQLIDWGFDQESATTGQFHQYIEYEDAKGKKQKISLPDVATTLRELFKMQTSLIQTVGLQTDIELKILQESTNSSLMAVEALKRVTDIQDYLDYPTQQKAGQLPVQITVSKDIKNIKEYLTNSELTYKWDDWTPDQGQSFQEQLNEIRMVLNALRANQGGEKY